MNITPILLSSIFILSVLTGCSKTYTADYLMTDNTKRKEILADCKENNQSTENCNNAHQAKVMIEDKFKKIIRQYVKLKAEQERADYRANRAGLFFVDLNKHKVETKSRQEQMEQLKKEGDELMKFYGYDENDMQQLFK